MSPGVGGVLAAPSQIVHNMPLEGSRAVSLYHGLVTMVQLVALTARGTAEACHAGKTLAQLQLFV